MYHGGVVDISNIGGLISGDEIDKFSSLFFSKLMGNNFCHFRCHILAHIYIKHNELFLNQQTMINGNCLHTTYLIVCKQFSSFKFYIFDSIR